MTSRKGQWKSKTPGYWWTVYFPEGTEPNDPKYAARPFLMSLGKWPYGVSVHEVFLAQLSDEGLISVRDKSWRTHLVSSDVTQDWEEAERIAKKYFEGN